MQRIFDDPRTILILKESFEKDKLLKKIIEYAFSIGMISDIDSAYDAIIKRENLSSTGIGDGVAIPHAKLPSVNGVNVIFFYLPNGVDFESVDNNKVKYIFLIFSHEKETTIHLKTLASIAKLVKNTDFIKSIKDNSSTLEIHQNLKKFWSEIL